ncbi:MAG TPA: hypothetical protein DCM86_01625 [Verrucomicrobiales bacterium]|nr:hypothetical protein [Verrucomicrobiales bacterium]
MPDIPLATSLACDPPLQRRAFLNLLGGTGLAGAVLSRLPAQGGTVPEERSLRLDAVTPGTFHGLVGSGFRLESPERGALTATLMEVRELGRPGGAGPSSRAPFGLTFHLPGSGFLPQQTYALRHPELGRLDLFLVPVRQQGNDLTLEAIFG